MKEKIKTNLNIAIISICVVLFMGIIASSVLAAFPMCAPSIHPGLPEVPIVVTQPVSDIEKTTTIGHGSARSSCDSGNIYEVGIEWGINSGHYLNNITDNVSFWPPTFSTFSIIMTGLNSETTYYYRAKAQNTTGWGYGEEQSFTHLFPSEQEQESQNEEEITTEIGEDEITLPEDKTTPTLQQQIIIQDNEIASLKNQVSSIQTNNTFLQQQIASPGGQIITLKNQLKEFQRQIADLQGQLVKITQEKEKSTPQVNEEVREQKQVEQQSQQIEADAQEPIIQQQTQQSENAKQVTQQIQVAQQESIDPKFQPGLQLVKKPQLESGHQIFQSQGKSQSQEKFAQKFQEKVEEPQETKEQEISSEQEQKKSSPIFLANFLIAVKNFFIQLFR